MCLEESVSHHHRGSALLLVDGYNVIAPVAPPRNPGRNWLQRERMELIHRLSMHLDATTRDRTCVVFDAADPPPGRAHRFDVKGIDVVFAVEYPEADDLLEELITAHSSPKSLAVVSSDQRIQTAAKRRGCRPFDAQHWLDELLEGRVGLAIENPASDIDPTQKRAKPEELGSSEVKDWMREFGFDD